MLWVNGFIHFYFRQQLQVGAHLNGLCLFPTMVCWCLAFLLNWSVIHLSVRLSLPVHPEHPEALTKHKVTKLIFFLPQICPCASKKCKLFTIFRLNKEKTYV